MADTSHLLHHFIGAIDNIIVFDGCFSQLIQRWEPVFIAYPCVQEQKTKKSKKNVKWMVIPFDK